MRYFSRLILVIANLVGVLTLVVLFFNNKDTLFGDQHRDVQWDPAFTLPITAPQKNPDKLFVILLGAFRGGTSFTSEIFNANPHINYLFEPLYHPLITDFYNQGKIIGAGVRHSKDEHNLLYLQQIFYNCSMHHTAFPERYEWCGTEEENYERLGAKECPGPWNAERPWLNQEFCRTRKTTVLKTIRLLRIKDLYKIKHIEKVNLKIVHLIRDPRAMMASRRTGGAFFLSGYNNIAYAPKAELDVKTAWEANLACHGDTENIEFVQNSDSEWLKSRYMIITHRQMSIKPLQTAQKVYDFLRIPLLDNIKEYLVNITHGVYGGGTYGPLLTAKNSTEILDNWKKSIYIDQNQLRIVEEECKELMEKLNIPFEFTPLEKHDHLSPFYDIN